MASKTEKAEKPAGKTLPPQPEINIGMVGHVDHGKTTLVQILSGKWTDTHSEEIKRGITIRLGYADLIVYRCPSCPEPQAWSTKPACSCGATREPVRKISLVDAPGHESLMATMLCGANIMDGALLLVAANESCPQPQTREHLQALEIMGMENLIVIQNKIDLVSEEQAEKNHKEIQEFLKGTRFEQAPIIPISALHDINIDVLLQAIQERFRTPPRDPDKHPLFLVARSFDVNKPGALPAQMKGGVIGGALRQGRLRVGDEIEILPGYDVQEKNVKVWKPLRTKVTALMTGGTTVDEAVPGGSVGVGTLLDPSVVKSDKLVGSVAGVPGKLPKVWHELALEVHLLERVVGAKDKLVVEPLKPGELLMLNVYAAATVGIVKDLSKGIVRCTLRRPVCAEQGARVTLSRSVGQRWRLIGWASIK